MFHSDEQNARHHNPKKLKSYSNHVKYKQTFQCHVGRRQPINPMSI